MAATTPWQTFAHREMPIVRTKLAPPRLPARPVALERHGERLSAVLAHALTLVCAPSGYGKSTMCTAWFHELERAGTAVAWVSMDREDDDPSRAIRYVLAALRGAGLSEVPAWDGFSPPAALAAALVNAVDIHPATVVLFLDDADRLEDPRVLQFLAFVLLHRPAHLHLVAACQRHPRLPLTRLAARGELIEIGQEALELSDEEAAELLVAEPGIRDASEARRLNVAMAGWVTGLRIGSAALRNNRDALLDIGLPSKAMHWLDDYLDENIFRHLPAATQRFLKRCAIVEVMEPDLCTALTDETAPAVLLNWLADQNLFIQRLDDAGTNFRIHPVFRRFLLARLDDDAGDLTGIHVLASEWLAVHGRTSQAIDHALAAGRVDLAASQIDGAAMLAVERSEILTLLGWIARLPEEMVARHPRLRLGQAWSLTLALRGTARGVIDGLHVHAREHGETALSHELHGIEAIFMAVYEDRLDSVEAVGRSFLAAPHDETSFVSRAVRNAVAFAAMAKGDGEQVHDIVRPSQLAAMRQEQLFTTAYRHAIIGLAYRAQGELGQAERVFAEGVRLTDADGGRLSTSSSVIAPFLARSLYERGDVDGATALLRNRLSVIDEAAFPDAVIDAYLVMCRAAALTGGAGEAVAILERAELIGHERGWRRLLANCLFERARLGLPFTTDPAALAPIDSLREGYDPLSLDARTRIAVLRALALRSIRRGETAIDAIDAIDAFASTTRNACLSFEGRLMRLLGDRGPSVETSAECDLLAEGAGRGYARSIVDLFAAVDDVRLTALCRSDARLQPLLTMPLHLGQRIVADPEDLSLFSLLTAREMDVLVGVARGQSNKEIARLLHLTPETIKWHLKNLMRKLGADSRTTAVARATQLGFSA